MLRPSSPSNIIRSLKEDSSVDLFISVGVFIHWDASDDKKIQEYNYTATKEAIARAVAGQPSSAEVQSKYKTASHPFAA